MPKFLEDKLESEATKSAAMQAKHNAKAPKKKSYAANLGKQLAGAY